LPISPRDGPERRARPLPPGPLRDPRLAGQPAPRRLRSRALALRRTGRGGGRVPPPRRHLRPGAPRRPGSAFGLPHRPRQGGPRGGIGGPHPRVHARRRRARGGEPVERRGPRHRRPDEALLRRDAAPEGDAGGGAAGGAARHGRRPALARPLLLGRLFPCGGMAMKPPSGGPPRSGLTAASFEALLARLDSDRERAGERYETIRRRLVRLFEWRGGEGPEELADETINRVARRMSEGTEIRATDPLGYFFGVAHRVYKEVLRARQKERERVASGGLAQASETAADEE